MLALPLILAVALTGIMIITIFLFSRHLSGQQKESISKNKLQLDNLKNEEIFNDIIFSMRELLAEDEKKIINNYSSIPDKGKVLKQLWQVMDPDLVTSTNERYIEHLNRIKFARTYYK